MKESTTELKLLGPWRMAEACQNLWPADGYLGHHDTTVWQMDQANLRSLNNRRIQSECFFPVVCAHRGANPLSREALQE